MSADQERFVRICLEHRLALEEGRGGDLVCVRGSRRHVVEDWAVVDRKSLREEFSLVDQGKGGVLESGRRVKPMPKTEANSSASVTKGARVLRSWKGVDGAARSLWLRIQRLAAPVGPIGPIERHQFRLRWELMPKPKDGRGSACWATALDLAAAEAEFARAIKSVTSGSNAWTEAPILRGNAAMLSILPIPQAAKAGGKGRAA